MVVVKSLNSYTEILRDLRGCGSLALPVAVVPDFVKFCNRLQVFPCGGAVVLVLVVVVGCCPAVGAFSPSGSRRTPCRTAPGVQGYTIGPWVNPHELATLNGLPSCPAGFNRTTRTNDPNELGERFQPNE